MKKKIPIIISAVLITLTVGCGSNGSTPVCNNGSDTTMSIIEETKPKILDVHTIENRENELVFDFSIDDFIESYNGYYKSDKGTDFLSPSGSWNTQTLDTSVHSSLETQLFAFSVDPKSWALPTMWVFVPPEGDFVQEIALNFDWHSYSENLYDLYSEMCFYTLKATFPELSDDAITGLYTKVNELGYNDPFPAEQRYESGSLPHVLYYKGSIGVYPYFALGSYQRLCIIPVTEAAVNELRQKGVQIYEIGN